MKDKSSKKVESVSLIQTTIRAAALVLLIPFLTIIWLVHENIVEHLAVLFFLFAIMGLGFYLLWTVVRGINAIFKGLEGVSHGEELHITEEEVPAQLKEMTEIIKALNELTVEFRENASQLETFIQQFATLTELSEISAKIPDIDGLMKLVLQKSLSTTHARLGSVMLLGDDEQTLQIVATEGWDVGEDKQVSSKSSLAGKVMETGHALRVENIEEATGLARSNNSDRYNSHSFMIMPLLTKNGTLGVVSLADKSTGAPFNNNDEQFLSVMLGNMGFAVENARLLKQARDSAFSLKSKVSLQKKQLEVVEGELHQNEKLTALGQLAGGVAHDFNNLIQAIIGYAQFAKRGLSEEEKRSKDLDQVLKAAYRGADLTAQLLAFGRRQVLQSVDLDVDHVIEDVMKMLERLIGADIELRYLPNVQGTAHADPMQLQQVLLNLCINARDAMPNGGSITIKTSGAEFDEEFCQSNLWAHPGKYVSIQVKDTGTGMDERTLSRIFEPFYTTKEEGKGTGLGLSTVYGIVRQHDGLIDVESQIDKGSCFTIYLPTVNRSAQQKKDVVAVETSGGVETLLVAEDDSDVAEIARRALEEAGYKVLIACDGQAAINTFEVAVDQIDLVVLDAIMPKRNGMEVFNKVREIRPDLPVLFSSGYSPEGTLDGLKFGEGLQLISKPYQADELLEKVREMLDVANTD